MKQTEELELRIAAFLRYGVIVSGVIMALGWVASLKFGSDPFMHDRSYHQASLLLQLELDVMAGNWGRLLCYGGLCSLISLPVSRVFLSMLLFVKRREWEMAVIGLLVLAGLVLSFSLGIDL